MEVTGLVINGAGKLHHRIVPAMHVCTVSVHWWVQDGTFGANAPSLPLPQGVVTSIPPVDTLVTRIKNFDRRNLA